MRDGVTDNIVWIQGTRMPWFNTRLGHLKKKSIHLLYVLYIMYIYIIYIVFIFYAYYISYILHIYVESKVCVI